MIVGVQGTNSFSDYKVFLRSMAVALSALQDSDDQFLVYSAGPANINSMVSEFINLSEKGLKARGKKTKFFKVAPQWISENLDTFDYVAFLSNEGEPVSKLMDKVQETNVDFGIFRY